MKRNIKLLSHFKFLKASSLVETIVAMVVVTTCIAIAFVVYSRVITSDTGVRIVKLRQLIKKDLLRTRETKIFRDSVFEYAGCKVQKNVESLSRMFKINYSVYRSGEERNFTYLIEY